MQKPNESPRRAPHARIVETPRPTRKRPRDVTEPDSHNAKRAAPSGNDVSGAPQQYQNGGATAAAASGFVGTDSASSVGATAGFTPPGFGHSAPYPQRERLHQQTPQPTPHRNNGVVAPTFDAAAPSAGLGAVAAVVGRKTITANAPPTAAAMATSQSGSCDGNVGTKSLAAQWGAYAVPNAKLRECHFLRLHRLSTVGATTTTSTGTAMIHGDDTSMTADGGRLS